MTIFSGVGSSPSTGPTSGGKIYAYNAITTTPATVAAPNPARVSITFHNPGAIDIFIAPGSTQETGTNVPLNPTNSALGGCIRVFANGGQVTFDGECQHGWKAFAVSGSTNPLTVIDSNV